MSIITCCFGTSHTQEYCFLKLQKSRTNQALYSHYSAVIANFVYTTTVCCQLSGVVVYPTMAMLSSDLYFKVKA